MGFCEHCKAGHALPGEPKGSMQGTAYFSPGRDSSRAIIYLTDAFGLPLRNSKIIADQLAEQVGCDVWAPDIFNGARLLRYTTQYILMSTAVSVSLGNPPFAEEDLVDYLPEQPGKKIPFKAIIGLLWTMVTHLPRIISNRPGALDSRIQDVGNFSISYLK